MYVLKREDIHMLTAIMWSRRSKCKRAQVGVVITSLDKTRILAVGYNGPARGVNNDNCTKEAGSCGCLHAEENALIRSGFSDGPRALFTTTFPCRMCVQRCINGGIKEIYYLQPYRDQSGAELLGAIECVQISQDCLRAAWLLLTASLLEFDLLMVTDLSAFLTQLKSGK